MLSAAITELGGEIRYGTRVAEILTERTGGDRATGVRARRRHRRAGRGGDLGRRRSRDHLRDAGRQVCRRGAARLLRAREAAALSADPVRRRRRGARFADETQRITGLHFPLAEPIGAGAVFKDELSARIVNFDTTMAPEGKTVITTILEADGEYWCRLREQDKKTYAAEKARIGEAVVRALDGRFPGLKDDVEMVDVATPATTVRYTGNWRASFEGWLPAPGLSHQGTASSPARAGRLLHGGPVGPARRRSAHGGHDGARDPATHLQTRWDRVPHYHDLSDCG